MSDTRPLVVGHRQHPGSVPPNAPNVCICSREPRKVAGKLVLATVLNPACRSTSH